MKIQDAIKELSKPLPIKDIDWRVGSIKEKNGKAGMSVLGYKDARIDMHRLDEVLNGCWSPSYQRDSKGVLQCTISIFVEMPDGSWQWVSKTSNGVQSQSEKEKGEYSDAFKRAGFMLGIGRELYDLPFIYITLDKGEFSVFKGKPRPSFGYNPNEFIWERDKNGLLLCKDKNKKIRFKEKKESQNKASKTNNNEDNSNKIKKQNLTEDEKRQNLIKAFSENKEKTISSMKSKSQKLSRAQANLLVSEKIVTKEDIADVVK